MIIGKGGGVFYLTRLGSFFAFLIFLDFPPRCILRTYSLQLKSIKYCHFKNPDSLPLNKICPCVNFALSIRYYLDNMHI